MILDKISSRITELAQWHDAELNIVLGALGSAESALEAVGQFQCTYCGAALTYDGQRWAPGVDDDRAASCPQNHDAPHEPKPDLPRSAPILHPGSGG